MRKRSTPLYIVAMMMDEDRSLPLEERNQLIRMQTGASLDLIERIRRDTAIKEGPKW